MNSRASHAVLYLIRLTTVNVNSSSKWIRLSTPYNYGSFPNKISILIETGRDQGTTQMGVFNEKYMMTSSFYGNIK